MKRFILNSLIILFSITVAAQEKPLSTDKILKDAFDLAVKENKKVFVMFHASWCGWCHKMDASMNDVSCKKFFDDNFIIRHLVVDESQDKLHQQNPGAEELKIKYHGSGQGIPFWLIFDKNGSLLSDSKIRKNGDGPENGENAGCPATEKEVDFFLQVLQKTSGLDDQQLDIIRKRFRLNEN